MLSHSTKEGKEKAELPSGGSPGVGWRVDVDHKLGSHILEKGALHPTIGTVVGKGQHHLTCGTKREIITYGNHRGRPPQTMQANSTSSIATRSPTDLGSGDGHVDETPLLLQRQRIV